MTHAPIQSIPATAPAALRSSPPAAVTLLRVHGEDAFSYLQSQVSADLRGAGEQWVRYALWLDASGHVLADSFILREGAESFLLFSYATPADRLEEIVLSNVIADDVEVEHLGNRYRHWALWAQPAHPATGLAVQTPPAGFLPQALQPEVGRFASVNPVAAAGTGVTPSSVAAPAVSPEMLLPVAPSSVVSPEPLSVAKVPAASLPVLLFAGRNASVENYDLLMPEGISLPSPEPASEGAVALQEGSLLSLVAALCEVPWAEREAQRIADGVPSIPADIGAGDLPQEGGDLARVSVSTSKGCYLGQEVIARWHATGQVRSGLFRVRLLPGKALAGAVTDPVSVRSAAMPDTASLSLPARLYAGAKPVGELRSYAAQCGAGLALLRIHRLGDVRAIGFEPSGEAVFEVIDPMLS